MSYQQRATFTPGVTHPTKLLSRTSSLPQSPQVWYRATAADQSKFASHVAKSPQTRDRAIAAEQPKSASHVARPPSSPRSFSTMQSDLVGCQRQSFQAFSVSAAPPDVQDLRAIIQIELRAFQKTLVAEREAAVKQFKVVTEECFQTERERQMDLVKQHFNLEKNIFRLEGDLIKIDSNLSRVVAQVRHQQMSGQAQHQVFENQATKFFQSLVESMRSLQQKMQLAKILQDDAWSAVAEAEQACRNLDGHGSKGQGGLPVASSASSTCAPFTASEKSSFLATNPWSSESESSIRIEWLEVALASMQQHEQEQIRRLQERIRDRREHCAVAFPSAVSGKSPVERGKSPVEKGRITWQDLTPHGTMLGA